MREHGSHATDDDTTRGALRPIGVDEDQPDVVRRRAIVGLLSFLIVGGTVGAIIASSGDDDPSAGAVSSPGDEQVEPDGVAVADDSVESVPEPEPADLPIHYGYNDEVVYVALYGAIDTDALGVLGEGDVAASVERAATVAADYEGFGPEVVPSFEILASVASFSSGDGDYSNEISVSNLQPWVDAADEAGYHVVLDMQSGREEFPSQILEFESLLLEPHVSVALDPEWRVGPIGVPRGGEIGTVAGDEVNRTVDYLDALIEANDLPPKMLIVHQFADSMIMGRPTIRGTDNVQVVIHMDGFGPLKLKRETYARVSSNLPDDVVMGWKNFYDEDSPTPTAEETMENDPQPMFVSFQ